MDLSALPIEWWCGFWVGVVAASLLVLVALCIIWLFSCSSSGDNKNGCFPWP